MRRGREGNVYGENKHNIFLLCKEQLLENEICPKPPKVFSGEWPGHSCCCFVYPTGKAISHTRPLLSTESNCAPSSTSPVLLCHSGQISSMGVEAMQSCEPPPSSQEHNLLLHYLETKGQSKYDAFPPSDNHPATGLEMLHKAAMVSKIATTMHRKGINRG